MKFSILFAFCLDHFVSFCSNFAGNKLSSNLALFIKQIVLLKLFFFALLFCPDHTFKICLKQFENNIQDLAKEIILIILEGRTIIFVENFYLSNIWNNMLCSALKTELSNSLIFGMKLMEAKCKTLVLLLL